MDFLPDLATVHLVLVFLVPGAVTLLIFDLVVPSERRDWSASLLQILTFGAINFALFFWLLDIADGSTGIPAYLLGLLYLFVAPSALALGWYSLRRSEAVQRWLIHPTPTAWDHFFGDRESRWVLIHLKTGQLIGGFYSAGSFASSSPHGPDLYVREVWHVDERGRFLDRVPQTGGVYVRLEDCLFLEFFDIRPRGEDPLKADEVETKVTEPMRLRGSPTPAEEDDDDDQEDGDEPQLG